MSEMQVIQSALERAAIRRRWAAALKGLWQGLLVGSIVTLILIGAYHLLPLPFWAVTVGIVAPFACMIVGFVVRGWPRPEMAQVARWVDGKRRLQERLSTALEVSEKPEGNEWRGLVLSDAAQHARNLDPKQLLPLTLPRSIRWAVVALVLAAGLAFVPEYRTKAYLQKKSDERNIKEAGKQLAQLTRHSLEKRAPVLEPAKQSLSAVTNLGDLMATKTLTRSEALKDLANVAEQLKDQLKELGKDPALRRLEQAARSGSGTDAQSAASLQKQIEDIQKQLGSPSGKPDAVDKLQKELEKIKEAAKGLSDKTGAAGEAEKQKLSQALSALSKDAQDMGLQLPQIDDAINALAQNQTDLLLKDLQAATTDLEKMRDMAKNLQQLQQQMEKLGKDLAEQLKNGQPEAAQQTLQQMISQLKSANLTPEQMQKLMNEVSKAVSPAGNYGKVADHLKQASKQMQGGDKANAAQSLAAASKELDKLMQEMGDAQQMQDALDALKEASAAIGSGQGWQMARRGGAGKKVDEPGRGVGTWADENATWDGQTYQGWDNSGITRPDEDPRGHSDRGEGDLNDALKPSKVRGQFSPGAPMPSITLKGVSIKGTSKVAYEEAATAAQTDAQSALSQEKVPRAYQNAVKDYFDDLKK